MTTTTPAPATILNATEAAGIVLATSIDIDASIDRVWAVLTDFDAYGEWSNFASITGVAEQGTKLRLRMPGMAFTATLTVVQPERELRWAASLLGERFFVGQHSFVLSANPDGSTHLSNTEIFTGVSVKPFRRMFAEQNHADNGYAAFNRALKRRVETRG